MNIFSIINSGTRICVTKYFSVRYPIFLIFELTYRCNLRCLYCNRWVGKKDEEADTQTICRIIREGKQLGLLRAYFTGGEIFLRKDLAEIVEFCKKLRVMVELWTNGTMISDNADILKQADCLTLSLDGSKVIHDNLRGKGSFSATIEAARLAKKNGVYVSFNFTLTSSNTDSFPDAADIALSLEATIGFQPVSMFADCKEDIKRLFPSKEEFNKALQQVMVLKKKYPWVIENSFAHLDYLRSWSKLRPWPCLHGRAIFTVLPDASLVVCTNSFRSAASVNLKNSTLKEAISRMHPFPCGGCACYGAYDSSGVGSILPVSWEVFNFHVLNKWKK